MNLSFNIKEQVIIGIVIMVLISVIMGLFIFKPQYDRFSEARSLQQEELADQQKKQALLDSLKVAKKEAAVTEAKSLSLSKRMPEEADLPSVLVEIDELGKENNVKVLDIAPSAVVPDNGFSRIPIELKVAGTFFNITDFLYNLVKLPREYTLGGSSVELAEEGYPLLVASIEASTFIYTPNSKAAVAAESAAGGSTTTTPETATPQSTGSQ